MEKRLVTATATRDARITRAKERNGPALEWLAVSKRRGRRSFVLVAPKIKSTGRTVEREQKNARGRLRCSLFFQRHLFVDVIAEATPPEDGPTTFPFVSARGHRKRLRGLTAGDEGDLRLRRPVFHRVVFPNSFSTRQDSKHGQRRERVSARTARCFLAAVVG